MVLGSHEMDVREGRGTHSNSMLDFKHSLFFAALPLLCIVLNANQRTKMREA